MAEMAVKLTVHKIGPKQKIHNANQLALAVRKHGYTFHNQTALDVWENRADKIAFKTLEILSVVLGVPAGRLIENVPDEK